MKVAVYYNNHDVRIEERLKPVISQDELLVRVMASGICGSDVMEWYRLKKAPLVLGHEIAGEIVQVGQDVKDYQPGDRVFVSHHVPCNECRYCRQGHHTACETLHNTNFDPGGFSEYVRVPGINVESGVYKLPASVSYDAASFIEPLGCIVRAQRLANVAEGATVLILGSGISGLLHIKLLIANGAGMVIATDVSEYRLEAAKRCGATKVVNAKEDISKTVTDVNKGRLADVAIVCTNAPSAFNQAIDSVDRGGTVILFAPTEPGIDIPVPVTELWRNEITLMTSYGAAPQDLSESLKLISDGEVVVDDLITHRLRLTDIGKGFELVADTKECIKIIIHPFDD